jgi:hypothetical protein
MIHVTSDVPREQLEKTVDAELDAFDAWFRANIMDEPLVKSERSILKTYLGYKLGVANATSGKTAGVEAPHGA